MAKKNRRSMKVHGESGYKYKATPAIVLKGQWLAEMGFQIGDYISVSCEDGKIIIMPDTERFELEKAEQEFMDREMKNLEARFSEEKEKLHARFVAERDRNYGIVVFAGVSFSRTTLFFYQEK